MFEVDVGDDSAGVSNPSAAFYPSFTQMEQIHSLLGELLQTICIKRRDVGTAFSAINHVQQLHCSSFQMIEKKNYEVGLTFSSIMNKYIDHFFAIIRFIIWSMKCVDGDICPSAVFRT